MNLMVGFFVYKTILCMRKEYTLWDIRSYEKKAFVPTLWEYSYCSKERPESAFRPAFVFPHTGACTLLSGLLNL